MNITTEQRRRISNGVAALGVAAVLVTGATWRGSASTTSPAPVLTVTQAQQAPAARAGLGAQDSYAPIVKVVAPAVVTVRTEGRARMSPTQFGDLDPRVAPFFGNPFGGEERGPRSFRQRGLGSGVIVTGDGYILTNHHVIDSADDIRVELQDGRSLKAKLVGTDKPSDLALLKVDQTGLPTLTLGDSDAMQVGDVVLAVGNPLGIGQTVTMGIVSAKGRSTGTGDGSYEDFLQTDAPINQGNSGGALVNTSGELVGINSQIVSQGGEGNIGIGFAIPANMARNVMDQLKSDGHVRRSQLGVTVQPVTSELAESLGLKDVAGAIVSAVAPGSAAEHAGIKRGDVIKSFNGQPVHDFNALRNRVADAAPGSSAPVVVVRDGAEKTMTVTLDEAASSRAAREGADAKDSDKTALGVAVAPLSPEVASRAGLSRDTTGLVIQQVNPEGRAADAGLRSGDIILEVNRHNVDSPDDLREALRSGSDKPTLLLVRRDASDIFVTVRPNQG